MWTGTSFDCPSTQDQIVLCYSEFFLQNLVECNGGLIVAQPLCVNNSRYTSQLNISVDAGLNNKTVQCIELHVLMAIGTSTITVISGKCIIEYC